MRGKKVGSSGRMQILEDDLIVVFGVEKECSVGRSRSTRVCKTKERDTQINVGDPGGESVLGEFATHSHNTSLARRRFLAGRV